MTYKRIAITHVFVGTFSHTPECGVLDIVTGAAIGVRADGIIAFVTPADTLTPADLADAQVIKLGRQFLIPGFVDAHLHAPQYRFTGSGLGQPLLTWLAQYTFPTEERFVDREFAVNVYEKVVDRLISDGTTTANYMATIHPETTKALVDIIVARGQRALVGKVNQDRNSSKGLNEHTETSLRETEAVIHYILGKPLVTPTVIPRFAPTSTPEQLAGLSALAKQYHLPIHSHISENRDEVKWAAELFPEQSSYTDIYDHFDMMTDATIMAHAIYLSDAEIATFSARKSGVVHCPNSNLSLSSGILPLRRLLDAGVKVGLGTDMGGGYSSSMMEEMRKAIDVSTAREVLPVDNQAPNPSERITLPEAFYLATQGGAEVLGLGNIIGTFEPGKAFDALVIDPNQGRVDIFPDESPDAIFQKVMYRGDDRNIRAVYVQGRQIKK